MGNRLDAILTKPLYGQDSTSINTNKEYQHQLRKPSSHRHHIQRQTGDHQGKHVKQTQREKQYDNKTYIQESDSQKQRSSFVGSSRKKRGKLSSCPDLLKETTSWDVSGLTTGLREYKNDSTERTIDIKIYRSYTDLPSEEQAGQSLKIKVYRKSQESLTNFERVHSMPRGINRNESSEFSNSIESKLSIATQEYNRPPSRRSLSRCSNASNSAVNCRASINLDDFPNMETVIKKISTFEQFFNNLVVKYFKNLTILDQLASICVAIMPDRANQSVSLLQYLQSADLPPDLGRSQTDQRLASGSENMERVAEFCPALPDFLLNEIVNAKHNTPPENQASVCQDVAVKIIAHMAKEAACELCRLYEYQLSLIQETIAFRLLAKFAATNVFEAVKTRGKLLDRNTIISAAMSLHNRRSGGMDGSSSCPKWISVICFNKELKWNIYDIFRKSALRKDVFDCPKYPPASPSLSPVSIKKSGTSLSLHPCYMSADKRSFYPEGSPWKFYSNSESDPMTYGYRCQLVQWDFVRCCYRLSPYDETNFAEELPWRYDDVHRIYCPYQRLISDSHVLEYCNWIRSYGGEGTNRNHHGDYSLSKSDSGKPTVRGLEEFIRQLRSGPHVRDELKLVFRSVTGFDQFLGMDQRRSDVQLLRNYLIANEEDLITPSHCVTEVFSTPELNQRLSGIIGEDRGPKDAESLRKALAQVTMECDQLCVNLLDIESAR